MEGGWRSTVWLDDQRDEGVASVSAGLPGLWNAGHGQADKGIYPTEPPSTLCWVQWPVVWLLSVEREWSSSHKTDGGASLTAHNAVWMWTASTHNVPNNGGGDGGSRKEEHVGGVPGEVGDTPPGAVVARACAEPPYGGGYGPN